MDMESTTAQRMECGVETLVMCPHVKVKSCYYNASLCMSFIDCEYSMYGKPLSYYSLPYIFEHDYTHTYTHTVVHIVAVKQCRPLISIPHGHVVYQTTDTPAILPGDFASYSCDASYRLLGSPERFCLRNGSWSGLEPLCIGRQKLKYVIYKLNHSSIPKTETAKECRNIMQYHHSTSYSSVSC